MDAVHENSFVVYIRGDRNLEGWDPQRAERPLASYGSYADARRVQQELHEHDTDSVIRYQGMAGGGD